MSAETADKIDCCITFFSSIVAVMVLVNHYLAFQHFGEHYYSFSEVRTEKIMPFCT